GVGLVEGDQQLPHGRAQLDLGLHPETPEPPGTAVVGASWWRWGRWRRYRDGPKTTLHGRKPSSAWASPPGHDAEIAPVGPLCVGKGRWGCRAVGGRPPGRG